MIKRIYFCDRCKREVDHLNASVTFIKLDGKTTRETYEVCFDCALDFKVWLGKIEPK